MSGLSVRRNGISDDHRRDKYGTVLVRASQKLERNLA